MSGSEPECVICGQRTLGLNGWDGGFSSYRMFRALWDPPRVFGSSMHFSCLRGWEHRDEMLTELVDLATDSVLEYDVEVSGETHHITRTGLGYTEQLLKTDDLLVLQHNFSADWMIIDFTGGWTFLNRQDLLGLVRGEAVSQEDGWGQQGLQLAAAPDESVVSSWVLPDLLRHLGIEDRYPGLMQEPASLEFFKYNPASGFFQYWIRHPLTIHPEALAYFRDRYDYQGETAFTSIAMQDE